MPFRKSTGTFFHVNPFLHSMLPAAGGSEANSGKQATKGGQLAINGSRG
jgi:hypothetical protein